MIEVTSKVTSIKANGRYTGQTLTVRESKKDSNELVLEINKDGVNRKERANKISMTKAELEAFLETFLDQ